MSNLMAAGSGIKKPWILPKNHLPARCRNTSQQLEKMDIIADTAQPRLNLQPAPNSIDMRKEIAGPCALEDDDFPFEAISDIAEIESWRKEINRPVYHIHKWWAQRLGTVFRAISIGALSPSGTDVFSAFYKPVRIKNLTVFDPFMGSGTTVGEAAKLGARAIGRDINPVAHFLVRNALALHDRDAVLRTFRDIECDVAEKIRAYYKTTLSNGTTADVLYFFWVKHIGCPACREEVDLFSSRIFAKHTYPKRHPEARASCPSCGEVNVVRYDADHATCSGCGSTFNPLERAANGQKATCPHCKHNFSIAKTIRETNAPPKHRLYAKLILSYLHRKGIKFMPQPPTTTIELSRLLKEILQASQMLIR